MFTKKRQRVADDISSDMAGDRRLSPLVVTTTGEPQTDGDDDPIPMNPEGNEMAIVEVAEGMASDSTESVAEWVNNLVVGQQVDVLDSAGFWCEAEVSITNGVWQTFGRFGNNVTFSVNAI